MRSTLDDGAILHHQNHVSIADGRQTVRNNKCRAPFLKRRQCDLYLLFRFRIQRRCRLVQKQDRRVFQHRPGDRNPLALAA